MQQEVQQTTAEAGAPTKALIAPSRPEWAKRLNFKEYKFVQDFIVDLDVRATAARMWPREFPQDALVRAKRWLKKFRVAEAIDMAMSTDGGSARLQVLRELQAMAFVNPQNFFKKDADGNTVTRDILELDEEDAKCVAEVNSSKQVIDKADGVTITNHDQHLKFNNKQSALIDFAKILNMHKPPVEQKSGSVTVNITVTRFAHLDEGAPVVIEAAAMPSRVSSLENDE